MLTYIFMCHKDLIICLITVIWVDGSIDVRLFVCYYLMTHTLIYVYCHTIYLEPCSNM